MGNAAARVVSLLLAAGVALAAPPPASAAPTLPTDPTGDARARAHQLRVELAQLQTETEQATEDYDSAQSRLGQIVSAHILAEQQLQNAQNTVAGEGDAHAATIRALYRTGGPSALYATVFDSGDPGDVLSRLRAVQHLVETQNGAADSASALVGDATTIEAHLATLARQRTALSIRAASAMSRVQSSLSRQQHLVAQADAAVVRAEQAEAQQIAAASAAHAAQTLDAARGAALPGGPGDVGAPNAAIVSVALSAARAELGKPYRWGATGPGSFDCSGLTGWAYSVAGVLLPRTSRQQWFAGAHPGLGYLQPGDLLFWATNPTDPATIHHVALYIGNDQMIAAPHTGAVVSVQPVYLDGFIGAVRPTVAT